MTAIPFALPPELEAEVAVTAAELKKYINEALERVADSPPDHTVAMVVSFMALMDFLGEEVHHTTVADFFIIFTALFRQLTTD